MIKKNNEKRQLKPVVDQIYRVSIFFVLIFFYIFKGNTRDIAAFDFSINRFHENGKYTKRQNNTFKTLFQHININSRVLSKIILSLPFLHFLGTSKIIPYLQIPNLNICGPVTPRLIVSETCDSAVNIMRKNIREKSRKSGIDRQSIDCERGGEDGV